MDHMVVGDEPCSINKVVNWMAKSASASELLRNWTNFARSLDTQTSKVDELEGDLLLNKQNRWDVISKLLEDWKARCGKEATISKLLNILEHECGWKDIADHLGQNYKKTSYDIVKEAININTIKVNFQTASRIKQPPVFQQLPKGVKDFSAGSKTGILIISSQSPELTCHKITGIITTSKYYDNVDEYSCNITQSPTDENVLEVIKCNLDLEEALSLLCDKIRTKLVLVVDKNNVRQEEIDQHNIFVVDSDEIRWEEITVKYKEELIHKMEKVAGYESNICSAKLSQFGEKSIIQLLECIINPETGKYIFQNTIPLEIEYYIPRRLITRNVLSKRIFSYFSRTNSHEDLFFIKGMHRYDLSFETTATVASDEIIEEDCDIGANFIIFQGENGQEENHFYQISKLVGNRVPFHFLECIDAKLYWVKSIGSVSEIQKFVEIPQKIVSEENFINNLVALDAIHVSSVIISGSPGMGKSVLLANIGSMLIKKEPEKHVVFAEMRQLVKQIKDKNCTDNLEQDILAELICFVGADKVACDKLEQGKQFIGHMLLDGFDEINAEDIMLGYRCLKILRSVLKNTKIWITTRSHMLLKVEETLQVLGYTIQPFTELEQATFLKTYWFSKHSQINLEEFDTFGKKCLLHLKTNINKTEEDFAGLPLHCKLIGSLYEDDLGNPISSIPLIKISFVSDLYEQVINKKIQKFGKNYANREMQYLDNNLEQVHVYHAIKSLCSSVANQFEKNVSTEADLVEVFNVGFMECKRALYKKGPQFVHRTFAEYFLAKYAVETIFKGEKECPSPDLLFNGVLETIEVKFILNDETDVTKCFKYETTCYFLNMFLRKIKDFAPPLEFTKKCESLHISRLKDILEACAYNNFCNIFLKFFSKSKILETHASEIFSHKYLVICTLRGSASMTNEIYDMHKRLNKGIIADTYWNNVSLLHVAATRGNYSIVERLVLREYFRDKLDDSEYSNLIKVCVKDSANLGERLLKEKKNIICFLAKINTNLFHPNDDYLIHNHPLIAQNVHTDLWNKVAEIIQDGKDNMFMGLLRNS